MSHKEGGPIHQIGVSLGGDLKNILLLLLLYYKKIVWCFLLVTPCVSASNYTCCNVVKKYKHTAILFSYLKQIQERGNIFLLKSVCHLYGRTSAS